MVKGIKVLKKYLQFDTVGVATGFSFIAPFLLYYECNLRLKFFSLFTALINSVLTCYELRNISSAGVTRFMEAQDGFLDWNHT